VLVQLTDVTQPAQVAALIDKVRQDYGRLDVLVNNAGVSRWSPSWTCLRRHAVYGECKFLGTCPCDPRRAPLMPPTAADTSSGRLRRGAARLPFMAVYSATKSALAGLTESLRPGVKNQKHCLYDRLPRRRGHGYARLGGPIEASPAYHDHAGLRIPAARVARAIRKAMSPGLGGLHSLVGQGGAWLSVLFPSAADFILRRNYKQAYDGPRERTWK